MKKTLTILAVLIWTSLALNAQQGEIIYTDYEPDTCKMITDNHESDFMFDIDHDGVVDMTLFGYTQHGAVLVTIDMSNGFELCRSNENTVLNADTIVWFGSDDLSNSYPLDSYRKSVGFRKTVNGHYFYGWMEVYWDGVFYSEGKMIYVDRIAFCTIPDYPLVWGQTEIPPQPAIIYTDYEPDSLVELKQYDLYPESKMMIDFDFDSIPDIRITYYAYGTGGYWYDIRSYEPEWELHEYEVGDTLMPMDDPELRWSTRILWERYFYNEIDTISDKFAVRHKVGDSYYYGWFRAYITMCPPSPYPWVALDKMAYCTIPDYPLIWGQTSLDQIGEEGAEWYYEILNDNGSITYQHLECAADTTINGKRPKIIIRSNTQYDKDLHTEVTHEYIYEENGVVYWWNKTLEEFTMLYNLAAEVGDEWEIKVGAESLTMHVDAVENIDYEGRTFRMLRVSDENDLFSGNIVCGIGHLTSFFPERLMTRGKGYHVEGLRCYWLDDNLIYKLGDEDCDAIYEEWHHGIDETMDDTAFAVYPNPANNVLFVETCHGASLPTQTYCITNPLGQTILSGHITTENQQINIETLPAGMYFINVGNVIQKFVVRQ